MRPDIPQDTEGGVPMTLKEAITLFGYHQRSNLKPRTVRSYQPLLHRFETEFGERSFDSIGSDQILQFLETVTGNRSKLLPHELSLEELNRCAVEKRIGT